MKKMVWVCGGSYGPSAFGARQKFHKGTKAKHKNVDLQVQPPPHPPPLPNTHTHLCHCPLSLKLQETVDALEAKPPQVSPPPCFGLLQIQRVEAKSLLDKNRKRVHHSDDFLPLVERGLQVMVLTTPPPTPPLHHPTHARTQQPYPLLCPLPIAAPDTYTHSPVYTGWNCSGLGAVVQPAVLGVPAARGVRHTASIRCHRHRTTHMSSGESYRNSCICHVSSPSVPRQEFSLLSLL